MPWTLRRALLQHQRCDAHIKLHILLWTSRNCSVDLQDQSYIPVNISHACRLHGELASYRRGDIIADLPLNATAPSSAGLFIVVSGMVCVCACVCVCVCAHECVYVCVRICV